MRTPIIMMILSMCLGIIIYYTDTTTTTKVETLIRFYAGLCIFHIWAAVLWLKDS